MQPYFFPYIGYFQLVRAVDAFVIYDNIQYSKRGWINRNRYLQNGKDAFFTLPLKSDSDVLNISERYLAASFELDKEKLKRRIEAAYQKAPNFEQAYSLFAGCLDFPNHNLFDFLLNSLRCINDYLAIDTKLVISSEIDQGPRLRGQQRVIALCKTLDAGGYMNPIGGLHLYDKHAFRQEGIRLSFIETRGVVYRQFENAFVPNLSILDVLMFNEIEQVHEMLKRYELR